MALVQDVNGFKTTWVTDIPSDGESIGSQLNYLYGQKFTCPGTGTQEISRLGSCFLDASAGTIRRCIYTDSAGSPGSLVANSLTPEISFAASGWTLPHDYSTKPQLTGGSSYWLLCWGGTGADWRTTGKYAAGGAKRASCAYNSTADPSPGAWGALDYYIAVQAVYASSSSAAVTGPFPTFRPDLP